MLKSALAVTCLLLGSLSCVHGFPYASRLLRQPFHQDAALWLAYAARGLILGSGVTLLGIALLTHVQALKEFALCFVAEEAYECVTIMGFVRWSRARNGLSHPYPPRA